MSEYWKSTPKYWCKFCKVYVRDTKFDKQQHDATGRHQGNVQRSLRTLHRDHERQERDSQRAKDEVARLNGIVSGKPAPPASSRNAPAKSVPAAAPSAQAIQEDRKRQLAQLADMGVAIPKEFRADMALAGEWETTSSRGLDHQDDKINVKNIGIRKRKHEGIEEDEDEAGETVLKKGWGSTIKTYPGRNEKTEDIGALLAGGSAAAAREEVPVKKEDDADEAGSTFDKDHVAASGSSSKQEDADAEVPVVFKKRKSKVIKTG